MAQRPAKRQWTTTALPAELIAEIRAHIENDPKQEYTSVLEFLRDAVREKLDEVSPNRRAAKLGDRLDALKPEVDRAAAKLRPAFCHKCGAPLVPGALFCSSCRTKVG